MGLRPSRSRVVWCVHGTGCRFGFGFGRFGLSDLLCRFLMRAVNDAQITRMDSNRSFFGVQPDRVMNCSWFCPPSPTGDAGSSRSRRLRIAIAPVERRGFEPGVIGRATASATGAARRPLLV